MLREALVRLPVMDAVTTAARRHAFVAAMPRQITLLVTSVLVVVATPWVERTASKVVAALSIATLVHYPFYAPFGPLVALASIGQFFVEIVVLAPLTSPDGRYGRLAVPVDERRAPTSPSLPSKA